MNHSADETRASLANNLRYFIKWSLIALLIGGTGGLIGSLFSMGVSFATSFRMNHPNMLFFLPVSGILISLLANLRRFLLQFRNAAGIHDTVASGQHTGKSIGRCIRCIRHT